MRECKRIFTNRKMLLFLLTLCILNGLLFIYDQINTFEQTKEKVGVSIQTYYKEYNALVDSLKGLSFEEMEQSIVDQYEASSEDIPVYQDSLYLKVDSEISYLSGYQDYLDTVATQANSFQSISIFSKEDSFSSRNIEKTVEDYSQLDAVEPALGKNDCISSFFSDSMVGYLALLGVLVLVYQFLAERKKGLWDIVHTTKRGRASFARKRVTILFVYSFTICFVMYGTIFLCSLFLYGGGDDLNRPIQSLMEFQYCDLPISIGTCLFIYFISKSISIFLIGMIVWLVLSAISNVAIGVLCMSVLFAIEYGFYTYLPVQSIMNGFKYINIFSYINLDTAFSQYLNINMFGQPIGIRSILMYVLLILSIVITILTVLINAKKHPKESSLLLYRIQNRMEYVINLIMSKLTVCWFEIYKVVVMHKGVCVFILLIYIAHISISDLGVYREVTEQYLVDYYEIVEGPLSQETYQKLETISSEIEEEEQVEEDAYEQLQDGKISQEEYDTVLIKHDKLEDKVEAYERLSERIEELEKVSSEQGVTTWVFNDEVYTYLLGENGLERQSFNSLLILFSMVILFSTMFAYEKQSHMQQLVRSTKRGRTYLYKKKYCAAVLLTIAVLLITQFARLYNAQQLYGFTMLNASVQSISVLSEFPLHISIGCFLVLVYLLKLFMCMCVIPVVFLISMLVTKEEQAVFISTILIVIPAALSYVGVGFIQYISYLGVTSVFELVMKQSNLFIMISPFLIVIFVAVFCSRVGIRMWENKLGELK